MSLTVVEARVALGDALSNLWVAKQEVAHALQLVQKERVGLAAAKEHERFQAVRDRRALTANTGAPDGE